jgi:periplasmic copper chaperone A
MKNRFLLTALAFIAASASAHVSLEQPRGAAGSTYRGVLKVGHGCDGSATNSIALRVPPQLKNVKPEPKAGWNIATHADTISWIAASKESALPAKEHGEFVFTATLPASPQAVWVKFVQGCEQGSMEWTQVPAEGISVAGLKSPAALIEVVSPADMAASQSAPKVEGAWVRSAVPGQSGTGAFMRITAREPMQLVGIATPVAGVAEVHEMKMEGDVMRMRPVPKLELPAGQPVDLKPSGYHLMLQELKQPLVAGSSVPMTLTFRDAKGKESKLELKVPVAAKAPGGAAMPMEGHKH